MKSGRVIVGELPTSDEKMGGLPKQRPAVVISSKEFNKTGDAIVVFISSQYDRILALNDPNDIPIVETDDAYTLMGLEKRSVIRCSSIYTFPYARRDYVQIGKVHRELLNAIRGRVIEIISND